MTEIRASILVVDDQPVLLENIRLALESTGNRVWTAEDGIEALAILRKERMDLILADIAMPRMNGYQLYERVRGNPRWVTIPFIFLTARALDSDIRYGKEMGVDDYLTKPIQPEDLLAAVHGKLRRARQLARAPLRSPVPCNGALRRSSHERSRRSVSCVPGRSLWIGRNAWRSW